jgi:hypothetical protein
VEILFVPGETKICSKVERQTGLWKFRIFSGEILYIIWIKFHKTSFLPVTQGLCASHGHYCSRMVYVIFLLWFFPDLHSWFSGKKKKKIVLDFFLVLGFELSCLHLEPLHQPLFLMMGFFEIESCKLFAWDGFKLQSSWSLPPEKQGLQAWTSGTQQEKTLLDLCSQTSFWWNHRTFHCQVSSLLKN